MMKVNYITVLLAMCLSMIGCRQATNVEENSNTSEPTNGRYGAGTLHPSSSRYSDKSHFQTFLLSWFLSEGAEVMFGSPKIREELTETHYIR